MSTFLAAWLIVTVLTWLVVLVIGAGGDDPQPLSWPALAATFLLSAAASFVLTGLCWGLWLWIF